MNSSVDQLTLVGVGFALFLMAVSAFIVSRVKREAPTLWSELGSPSLFSTEARGVGRFWRWLYSGKHDGPGTSTILAVWLLRLSAPIYLLFFATMAFRVFL